MDKKTAEQLLTRVAQGSVSVQDALLKLRMEPFEDLGFAKIDHHRSLRKGTAEVIFGAGKTPEQIRQIAAAMLDHGERTILVTRLLPEAARTLQEALPLTYRETGQIGVVGAFPEIGGHGSIVIATGGTSDMRVAEEAAVTAEVLGNRVTRLYDVGVAGLHRLLTHTEEIMRARVVVAVAGMEGALASVVGGLASCPVIAVPTSVGYGASFGGLAALLSMLNSCASGVGVVNIDNGFGAGYLASLINHMGEGEERK